MRILLTTMIPLGLMLSACGGQGDMNGSESMNEAEAVNVADAEMAMGEGNEAAANASDPIDDQRRQQEEQARTQRPVQDRQAKAQAAEHERQRQEQERRRQQQQGNSPAQQQQQQQQRLPEGSYPLGTAQSCRSGFTRLEVRTGQPQRAERGHDGRTDIWCVPQAR